MATRNDIKENAIKALDENILKILLRDKTTKRNIMWATDNYAHKGYGYQSGDEITVAAITGYRGNVIKPRTEKSKKEQTERVKKRAEVFTPSWICNKQNNAVDAAWFGRDNIFNVDIDDGWVTIDKKIEFPDIKGKAWQDYVKANRLEISCGEAPYLVSRYDTVTGKPIPVKDRIGLLDRKLRVVSENVDDEREWFEWAKTAIQSVYGFDWQGDNVLLARENVLFSFVEHHEAKFGIPPIKEELLEIAKVVAWNIIQMDGIKFVVPNSCHPEEIDLQLTLMDVFDETTSEDEVCVGCAKNDHSKHIGIYSRTYDWSANRSVEFYSLLKGGKKNA